VAPNEAPPGPSTPVGIFSMQHGGRSIRGKIKNAVTIATSEGELTINMDLVVAIRSRGGFIQILFASGDMEKVSGDYAINAATPLGIKYRPPTVPRRDRSASAPPRLRSGPLET
jgi:hypothetical protein